MGTHARTVCGRVTGDDVKQLTESQRKLRRKTEAEYWTTRSFEQYAQTW